MAFVAEDGTGRSDATSLVSAAEASEYLAATGFAAGWSALSEEKKQDRLNQATVIAESSFRFRGILFRATQSRAFPRVCLYDADNRMVNGVPREVRIAISELAWALSNSNFMTDPELAALEEVRVGPIDVKFSSAATSTRVIPVSVLKYLSLYGSYRFGKLRTRRLIAG